MPESASLDRVVRTRRLFAVIAAINRESVRARDVTSFLEAAVRIVVEEGGFRFAWIGLKEAGGRVAPKVRAGFEDGYLEEAAVRSIGTDAHQGPTMRALRERRPAICNDVTQDPAFEPWREAALRRGYRASAAFPFERGGEPVGTLNVYATEVEVFQDDEVQLLARLAADIGMALERSEIEEQRRASEERYRTLFEQAGDGIMQFSSQRLILDVNAAMCAMHGYTREELIGKPIGTLMADPGIVDRLKVTERLEQGEVFRTERVARRKDGSTFPVESSVKRLENGERLAIVRDVSVRNRLNAEVAQNERLFSLGRLARGVAHEINNPLAYVMMNLELLERSGAGRLDSRYERAISSAQEGAERVRRIVRDLSTFGRGEEEEIGAIDVDQVLSSALNLTESLLKPVAKVTRDSKATRRARGNAYRLGQVAVNLLVNAVDAMASKGGPNELSLASWSDEQWVMFSVTDSGPGIDPALVSRIFDPFFTTKPVGAGTGLGLAIAHTIVTGLGGAIAAESPPGKGATFTVKLPAWAGPVEAASEAAAAVAKAPARRRRVLVVDDEPAIRKVLTSALAGDEVVAAAGGFEAAAICAQRPFDCILCDVTMPKGDAVDLLEALRAQGKGDERRVILMSGGAYSARTEALLSEVDNPRLDKPFTAAAASEAIDRLLEKLG